MIGTIASVVRGEGIASAMDTQTRSGERLLWVSSRAGLIRIRGDRATVFDRRHGLPSDAVRGLKLQHLADGTDLLWLATEGGIARAALADSQWQTVSLLGARYNGTFALLLEPDGRGGERLWVGSAKEGLGLLERGEWRYFSRAAGSLPTSFWNWSHPGSVRCCRPSVSAANASSLRSNSD